MIGFNWLFGHFCNRCQRRMSLERMKYVRREQMTTAIDQAVASSQSVQDKADLRIEASKRVSIAARSAVELVKPEKPKNARHYR